MPADHNPPPPRRHTRRAAFLVIGPGLGAVVLGFGAAAWAGPPETRDAWVRLRPGESVADVLSDEIGWSEGLRVEADGGRSVRVVGAPLALDRLAASGRALELERRARRDGYRHPDDALTELTALAEGAPRAGVAVLGASREGRPIPALWLGQAPGLGAPSVRVLGAHHGDEGSSWEVAFDLAETLAQADGLDPSVTALLDAQTVWIAPFVNPDGAAVGLRANAAGVDLNRNYDFEWSESAWGSGPAPFSEPETRAVRDHGLLALPHASLSLHSGAENIGYVWNFTVSPAPGTPTLVALAEAYAAEVDLREFEVTNGADWYITRGDANDWSYGRYGGMDFTVELTWDKTPPSSELPAAVAAHRDAALALLTRPPALWGTVSDAQTGDAVPARVTPQRGEVEIGAGGWASLVGGRFARHVEGPVTHALIEAPGYASARVAVQAGAALDVQLEPLTLASGTTSPPAAPAGAAVRAPAGLDGAVRLVRPGAERAAGVVGGALSLPADLAPGPYDLVAADGRTWPRAVVVVGGGAASGLALDTAGAAWVLRGEDLDPGISAYWLSGPRRAPAPLELAVVAADRAEVEPPEPGPGLLWVVSAGTHAAFPVSDDPPRDTDALDTGDAPAFRLERGGCTCGGLNPGGSPGAAGIPWSVLGLLASLALSIHRRRAS